MSPEMPGNIQKETEEVQGQRFAKGEVIIMPFARILAPGF